MIGRKLPQRGTTPHGGTRRLFIDWLGDAQDEAERGRLLLVLFLDGFVKSPIPLGGLKIGVTLHLSSLRRTTSTPHSSRFASLDLERFTKPSEN
jgi:hypothetical protein